MTCENIIGFNLVLVYITCILTGFLATGTIPLYFEASVEVSYPVSEGVTTGVVTLLNNIGCLIYLYVPLINSSTAILNFGFLVGILAGIIVILFFKEEHKRLELDTI